MKVSSLSLRSLVNIPFNALAAPVDLVFCIPIIGRLVKWAWNLILTILHLPFGMIEWVFLAKGYKPAKKLKLSFVLFTDEKGIPVINASQVVEQIEQTAAFYKDKANILVQSANSDASDLPAEDWIYLYKNPPPPRINRVGCNMIAFREDLWLTGMTFQFTALTRLFHTNFRRIIGYGSPIVVYIVKDVADFRGCSLGPLTDYVTVDCKGLVCMTHEIGHACTLFHENEDTENLMHPAGCEKNNMTTKQIAIMRASRHVTFM
jgi:hypothetical protein